MSKSPFLQMGDPLQDLMNKLHSKGGSSSSSSNKGTDLSAKYNPNEKGKSGTETLLNTDPRPSTESEIKKGQL